MILQSWVLPVFLVALVLLIIGVAVWLVNSFKNNKGGDKSKNSEATTSTVLFIIGGVPLLIYPFVLLANMMSLAGPWTGEHVLLIIVVLVFIAVSSAYPLTYFLCLGYFKRSKKIIISLVPILHIVVTILLGLLWGAIE
jgi:mannitol-specific phosphotransferase system IIBC component